MKLKQIIIFIMVISLLCMGCDLTQGNLPDKTGNTTYVLNSKTCKMFFYCEPADAEAVLANLKMVDGSFQSVSADTEGNLVLVLSQEDIESWSTYINELIMKRQEADKADGLKFIVGDDYKSIEIYTTRELFPAAGFNLTVFSTYCGIMQMLNGENPNEWYVDERLYDVETETLIAEVRFPEEGMSVNIEDWDRALKNAEK